MIVNTCKMHALVTFEAFQCDTGLIFPILKSIHGIDAVLKVAARHDGKGQRALLLVLVGGESHIRYTLGTVYNVRTGRFDFCQVIRSVIDKQSFWPIAPVGCLWPRRR